jgi:hypothetical protein
MNSRFRFGLRSIFAITTLSAFVSLAAAAIGPTIVQFWNGETTVHYIAEVEGRYNLFRDAIAQRDFAKADALLTAAYRQQLEAQGESIAVVCFQVPQAIQAKEQVRGRGNMAIVRSSPRDMGDEEYEESEGDFYFWEKIDGEWLISRIQFIYYIS